MKRFFEVYDIVEGMRPVNTNFPNDNESSINFVIICESPSSDEVAKGFPTVSKTGSRIFKNLVKSEVIISETDTYSYEHHYSMFAENGIYLTNLVRYQADLDVKGERAKKDARVRQLWKKTQSQIIDEIEAIHADYPKASVLVACGSAFESQITEVIRKINELGMPWFVTDHPSRFKHKYSSNYDPTKWDEPDTLKTALMRKIESKINRS